MCLVASDLDQQIDIVRQRIGGTVEPGDSLRSRGFSHCFLGSMCPQGDFSYRHHPSRMD
jgi:hypothetical protein